ncbi:flagellar motor switch protein FliN [Yersinia similis]|uniref:Flagellar motor switch protein FliN n=1 Tax=Yersinia similis TaxID=367190 RepID=A0A0T9RDV4_9GAMM|nr:flagellar motor switch protein FliN [Yersinia similis]AHK18587.1 flagellar switch protein [Yersinia similis]CFQ70185.1 flagellar switch protein [Yersinia similis]CNC28538.1 flagellar switch protein [Yersinia similis]CNF55012.1 flagellar switch protein [Yersinia similis]CNG40484.1 flagellar switch protein [Yersinia similis]
MTEQQIELNDDLDFSLALDESAISPTEHFDKVINAPEKTATKTDEQKRKMSLFSRIPVTLTLEVASVEIPLSELLTVNNDSVIELDKLAGEPLDIRVNGIMFGQAEVVVINEKYGLRIININSQNLGELAL